MTKKDYISKAKIVKDNTLNHWTSNMPYDKLKKDELVNDFVIMFKKDNNRFDKERFVNACK